MNKGILYNTAKVISYLFVPPVMNLLIFIIFSIIYENNPSVYYSVLLSFLFGFAVPVFTFLEFRRRGHILNDDATIKEERTIPYIFAIGFSLAGVILSSYLNLNENIIMLWMVYLICSIIIINVNKYWKISAHAMGAGMPLGAVFYVKDPTLIILFVSILIIISFSRLFLKVHTILQVISGAFTGFIISYSLLEYCL